MRDVVVTQPARVDIRGIVGYIAQDNPNAALRVETRIYETIDKLAFMPAARQGRVAGRSRSRCADYFTSWRSS
ncbi:MAG: type II toxin-antitoxin system RelE/ParE family toxin [Hyphomonadaceae bacterium]|nr:type II toxin-antitoxin system RelE/ParE family toxin [Hyphomonadaceae bacterium]